MGKNAETLHALIAAWRRQDVEGVLQYIHDDISWNNSAGLRAPLKGKAEMRKALERMAEGIEESRWRLFDCAEVGDTVWMEGVDEFIGTDGTRVAVPYAGLLEFEDGLIIDWREYFQGQLIEDMRAGKGVSAHVEAMLDRPVV